MGVKLYREPELEKPILIASWPGIGNVGIAAIDTLRDQIQAGEFGEIEPWDFFYPNKVTIRDGLLGDLEFPANRFYYKRLEKKDLILFIGEEQPSGRGRLYAEGEKAHEMANLVLDVAEKFGCQRVYTSGACVSPIHHTVKPRVISVVTSQKLKDEVKGYPNTILISEIEARGNGGVITGLNGLLLTVAKKRGLQGICIMGEVPDWFSGAPLPYPEASKSVLEVIADVLGIKMDFIELDRMALKIKGVIEELYEKFPSAIRERYDRRKYVAQAESTAITEEDAQWIKEHVEELFKKGKENGEQAI